MRTLLVVNRTTAINSRVSTHSNSPFKISPFDEKKQAYFRRINNMGLRNPRLIGFGISNKETLAAAFENASGAIIGSKFISLLREEKSPEEAVLSLLHLLAET
jgi:tryptophan synthase alpha chain